MSNMRIEQPATRAKDSTAKIEQTMTQIETKYKAIFATRMAHKYVSHDTFYFN